MDEQTPHRLNVNAMDFANDDVTEDGTRAIRYLASRLQEAQSNPKLRAIVFASTSSLSQSSTRKSFLLGTEGIAKNRWSQ